MTMLGLRNDLADYGIDIHELIRMYQSGGIGGGGGGGAPPTFQTGIGEVSDDGTARISVRNVSPNVWALDSKVPRGPAPGLQTGNTTVANPGEQPAGTVREVSPGNYAIDFKLPPGGGGGGAGQPGPPGPAPQLQTGNVATGAPGTPVTFSIRTIDAQNAIFAIDVSIPRGADGEPGRDGQGIAIKGSVPTYNDLPPTANPGDAYLVQADGKLYIWTDRWPAEGQGAAFKGDKGDAGATPTFASGNTELVDDPSQSSVTVRTVAENSYVIDARIPRGGKGADGVTPTIASGNTTLVPQDQVAVTVRSTGPNAYAIDAALPQPAPGTPGPAPTIRTGNTTVAASPQDTKLEVRQTAPGEYEIDAALAPGESLYQIARRNGFQGTEQEYLNQVLSQALTVNPSEYVPPSIIQPELAGEVGTSSWTVSAATVTLDANARTITFTNSAGGQFARHPAAMRNDTEYDVTVTVQNLTGGRLGVILYGATANNVATSPEIRAAGTHTFRMKIAAGNGSARNDIRIRALTSGTSAVVTQFTVKEVGKPKDITGPTPFIQFVGSKPASILAFLAPTDRDFTNAFRRAMENGPGVIELPPGHFDVEGIVINEDIDLRGAGRNRTFINIFGTGKQHGVQVRGSDRLGLTNCVQLSDLQIAYKGTGLFPAGDGPADNNWTLLYIQRKVQVKDVVVTGGTNDNVRFAASDTDESNGTYGGDHTAPFFCVFDRLISTNAGRDGCVLRGGANANTFRDCQFSRNGRYGFLNRADRRPGGNVLPTITNSIHAGQASYNGQEGYRFEVGGFLYTTNLYAELNGRAPDPADGNKVKSYISTPYDYYIANTQANSMIHIGYLHRANPYPIRLPGGVAPGAKTSLEVADTTTVIAGGRRIFGNSFDIPA